MGPYVIKAGVLSGGVSTTHAETPKASRKLSRVNTALGLPAASARPPCNNNRRSAKRSARLRSCSTMITAVPASAKRRTAPRMLC